MRVISSEQVKGSEREIFADNGNWVSRRFLLKKDGMGFSMHETVIFAGTETHIHYKNHLEAVYCVSGQGEIERIDTGEIYPIKPGVLYALDQHDEHYLRAESDSDLKLVCVFNPPLTGTEVHDENGVYPLAVKKPRYPVDETVA